MPAATLDAFLTPFVRRYEYGVPIPFAGLVTIGNVSEGERQGVRKWIEKKGNEHKDRARWMVECVYVFDEKNPADPAPGKMFTLEHVDALIKMDSAIATALTMAINAHCWPDEPKVGALEKNSDATTTGDSPSS